MKKLIAISILACLAIALVYTAAFAQSDEVLIVPHTWDEETIVYSDQFVTLGEGWAACHRGAVQSFLTATHISWTLKEDGDLIDTGEDTNQLWGPIHQVPPSELSEACMGKTPETVPHTVWRYPLGYLESGEYTLHFVWWFDHPITDVADYDGDGRPDLFKGTLMDLTIAIHVADR